MGYCSAARIGMCAETDAASRSAGMLLLNQFKLELPEQAPPRITADARHRVRAFQVGALVLVVLAVACRSSAMNRNVCRLDSVTIQRAA
jgi:hypothetical protein